MEESTEQILSTLAVIHRFMSAHTTFQDNIQGSSANVHEPLRLRTVSETENENTLTIVNIFVNQKVCICTLTDEIKGIHLLAF